MKRRSVLVGFVFPFLAACAARAPKAPLKPNSLERIGMLPIKEWPDSGGTAQFNPTMNPAPDLGHAPPPISPALLGMAIGHALRKSREADKQALANAITPVNFEPQAALLRGTQSEFERRAMHIAVIGDLELARRIRNDKLTELPTDVDAILDIQIGSAGYYDKGKGRGFSPYFQVTARLIDTVNQGEVIEQFSYEGDYNESKNDARYFTSPPTLSQESLAGFAANGKLIQAGLTTLFDHVAAKLVDDIIRVREKQARLN